MSIMIFDWIVYLAGALLVLLFLATAIKIFARRLRETTDFDAFVVPSLAYRNAKLFRRVAKWDGVVRRISDAGDESTRIPESYKGNVLGVSLRVTIFGVGGEEIFANYGGLGLAHSFWLTPGADGVLGARPLDEVLEVRGNLREGVELAFEPYLPRPGSSDW